MDQRARSHAPAPIALVAGNDGDIQWLFDTQNALSNNGINDVTIEWILDALIERTSASLGAILLPDCATQVIRIAPAAPKGVVDAYRSVAPMLLKATRARRQPLVSRLQYGGATWESLSIPILKRKGSFAGLSVLLRPSSNDSAARRPLLLIRHLAQQISTALDETYDSQTGLLARSAFEKMVSRTLQAGTTRSFAVLYLDVDSMHLVNESLGFDAGDDVIRRIADLLASPVLPAESLACRISGDGFAVLLPSHDLADAQRRVVQLQHEVTHLSIGAPDQLIALSISCGVALVQQNSMSFPQTLAAAELACRAAKEHGPGHTESFGDIDSSVVRRRQDMVRALTGRCALTDDSFEIHAQKIASLKDMGRLYGAECLLRLKLENGKLEAPADFLVASQRYRMMPAVDECVLRSVLEAVRPRAALLLRDRFRLTVNLSGQSLSDAACLQKLENLVRECGVAPSLLTFEITETAVISNVARVDHFMRILKRMGCRFALDDFGTGVNSLSSLKNLPVDVVKIDGMFVRDLLTNRGSQTMVRAIIQIVEAYGIECVAECVESDKTIEKLRAMGVGYAQGYVIHRPAPLSVVFEEVTKVEARILRRESR